MIKRTLSSLRNRRGQAFAELVFTIPVLLMVGVATMSVVYVCWQGIKTQEAANTAARIQGQERVGFGRSASDIDNQNRGYGATDIDPSAAIDANRSADGQVHTEVMNFQPSTDGQESGSVYGKYRKMVRDMFAPKERQGVYVPPPVLGANTDQVKVVRVITPPKIFGIKMNPVVIESTAYGGEDPHAHALPRAGQLGGGDIYWKKDLKGND